MYFSGLAYRSSPSPVVAFLLSIVTEGVSSLQFFFASEWWVHLPTLVSFRGAVSLSFVSVLVFFFGSSVSLNLFVVNFGVKAFFSAIGEGETRGRVRRWGV